MLAQHAAPPVNSCPPGVGRGVHPFLYRWTNAPTRNPVPSSAYVAKVLHPLLDSTSSGQTARSETERAPKRSGEPARRGDTTLLTRVRCAHLGVTHSFVPSDQRGRRRGRKRESFPSRLFFHNFLNSRPCPPRSVDRLVLPPSIILPRSPCLPLSLPPRSISFCTTSLLCLPFYDMLYDTLAYSTLFIILFLINYIILLTFYYHLNYMYLTFIIIT
ncbi:hypothetical protein ALC53_04793 [Atta colombica]|uniref:Uncharacterized protein n=1 Tax=Atta colombica TaxID=520822 RepID=A0A195BK63_9HYME|nr:hypothetical protein ALC53_04793 [Atta colombica]